MYYYLKDIQHLPGNESHFNDSFNYDNVRVSIMGSIIQIKRVSKVRYPSPNFKRSLNY